MEELVREWQFVRSETIELLSCLNDKRLAYIPKGEKWQPLSYQFACIGRTQLVYAGALKKGIMDFSEFGSAALPKKQDIQSKHQIAELLEWSDAEWAQALLDGKELVSWPDMKISNIGHAYRLISHERLHHGQLISYFTLAGFQLPRRFKGNWAL